MPKLKHAANDQRISERSDSDADVAQKKLDNSCTGPPKRNRKIVTDDDDDHCAEPQPPEQSTPLQQKSDSDDNFGVILLSEQQRSQLASQREQREMLCLVTFNQRQNLLIKDPVQMSRFRFPECSRFVRAYAFVPTPPY